MSIRPVIFLFKPQRPGSPILFPVVQMQAYGLEILPCPDMRELYGQVQSHFSQAGVRVLVVLDGSSADNRIASAYLRVLYPAIGIVSLGTSHCETAFLQAMQSGADNYCLRDASFELLLAVLLRLLSRVGCSSSVVEAAAPSPVLGTPGFWVIQEHGWILIGPQQQHIPLTTGERAFLTTLFAQPDLRASHRQLIDAINASYAGDIPPAYQGRLGLLVSRLRRKLRERGTQAPLKSLHRWGYMFTGPVL